MATVYSDSYWTGDYTYTRVKVDYSGTTATATLLYTRTNTYSGATSSGDATFTFGGQSVGFDVTFYGQQTDAVCASLSFNISASGGTYSGNSTGGYMGGSWSVTIPNQIPTGLEVNGLTPDTESFTGIVSVTSWANLGSYSTRRKRLQVWTYSDSGLTTPYRYSTVVGSNLSDNLVVNNNSTGTLVLVGNTRYVIGAYATNGTASTGNVRKTTGVTLAYAPTVTFSSATSSSASFSYSAPADGGYYTKTYQYSLDNGATWANFSSSSSSSATSGTFTISGLVAAQSYTLRVRTSTTAGTKEGASVSFETIGPDTPTVSVSNSETTDTITYAVESFNGGTDTSLKLYYSAGSSTPTTSSTLLATETSAGTYTFTHSNLQRNQLHRYRAYAQGAYSGSIAGVYSTVADQYISPPTPTIQAETISYDSETQVTVRLTISAPADGGYYNKQYRYKVGSAGTQVVLGTKSSGDGSASTYTVDVTQTIGTTVTYYGYVYYSSTSSFSSNSYATTQHTAITHDGPTGVAFNLSENNQSLKSWLSSFSGYQDGNYFVGNQSQIKVTIPQNSTGTTTDGAVMSSYRANLLDGTSGGSSSEILTIPYVAGQDLVANFTSGKPSFFPAVSVSEVQTYRVELKAIDSMYGTSTVTNSTNAVRWISPTISVSAERLNSPGSFLLNFSGEYSGINFGSNVNNGNDCNSVTVEYRFLRYDGSVLADWSSIADFAVTVKENELDRRVFTGAQTVRNVDYSDTIIVQMRVNDHFSGADSSAMINAWDSTKVLYPAEYDIEVWDWKTNSFLADVSNLVIGGLNIEWELNGVEQVSFDLDLLAFEKKCEDTGVDPTDLLIPYAHDIRIRRNGVYIVGCNLVEANIQIGNEPPAKIQVKGTGYLNCLKDQYLLSEAWSGYTYAEIAKKLVSSAQLPDCLIKNPTGDIDTSYWLAANGTVYYSTDSHSGKGCIGGSRSGTGWITIGSQMNADTGRELSVDMWVKGQSGAICYIRERQFITVYSGQNDIAQITLDGNWQHIQVTGYKTFFENGYIIAEMNRTDSSTNLKVDDCYVYLDDDNASLCNMNIPIGVDTASASQNNTREVNYEVQNIKDALIDLTQMEDDNFDFEFLPDRTFNIYSTKGSDKLDVEVLYPGNVDSMTIRRSASNLANKIVAMGSGIGDERLQTIFTNTPSRTLYGTHESVITDSNVSLLETLRNKTVGQLYDRKDVTNLPRVKIRDGSVNPSNIQTGDSLYVDIQGDSYLSSAKGVYRVVKISLSVTENSIEEMDITFDTPIERPAKKMVRYIRESIMGSNQNYSNHWIEVQALVLVGNEYVNVAQGKSVYSSKSFYSGEPGSNAVDNNMSTYAGISETSKTRDAITIDLGEEYPLDYVKIYHYYADGRTYYGSHLSVGTSVDSLTSKADLEDVLWSYGDSAGWEETAYGKRSEWLQNSEVVEG